MLEAFGVQRMEGVRRWLRGCFWSPLDESPAGLKGASWSHPINLCPSLTPLLLPSSCQLLDPFSVTLATSAWHQGPSPAT